jgi:ribosomal silencing factor RsfS
MNEIIVKPVNTILDKVIITNVSVNLGVSAYIIASVVGAKAAYTMPLLMEGEDYQNWGDDDTYLENWVLSQLGLEKA